MMKNNKEHNINDKAIWQAMLQALYFIISLFKSEAGGIVSCMDFCSSFLPGLCYSPWPWKPIFSKAAQ